MSEKMFISKIMKGLPKEYESFTTLVKFSKEEKGLEEIKRDPINFDNENVQKKNESIFYNKERKCFNCQNVGHIAKDCRLKKANIEQIRGQPLNVVSMVTSPSFVGSKNKRKSLQARAESLVKIFSRGLRV